MCIEVQLIYEYFKCQNYQIALTSNSVNLASAIEALAITRT